LVIYKRLNYRRLIGGTRLTPSSRTEAEKGGSATMAHRRARGGRVRCRGQVRPRRLEAVPCSAASPMESYGGTGVVEVCGDGAASWRSSSLISPLARRRSSYSFPSLLLFLASPPLAWLGAAPLFLDGGGGGADWGEGEGILGFSASDWGGYIEGL